MKNNNLSFASCLTVNYPLLKNLKMINYYLYYSISFDQVVVDVNYEEHTTVPRVTSPFGKPKKTEKMYWACSKISDNFMDTGKMVKKIEIKNSQS